MGARVRVEPSGREFDAQPGESIMAAANRCGLRWPTLCQGQGTCTLCHCQVINGAANLAPVSDWEAEHLRLVMGRFPGVGDGGVRLACQARVAGPVVVRKAGVRPAIDNSIPDQQGEQMSQEQVTIVRRFLDGFVAGDLDACMNLVHPDLVLNEGDSLPYPGDHFGRDGFQALVATMLGHFEVKLADVTLLDTGNCVVGKILIEFTSRLSGRTLAMPVVEFYDIVDGMLHCIDVYYKDAKAIADLAAGR